MVEEFMDAKKKKRRNGYHPDWAKRKAKCFFKPCGKVINKGDKIIRFSFPINKTLHWYKHVVVHLECYFEWLESWWKTHPYVEPHRHKAPMMVNPLHRTEYRRLTARARYYRRMGNADRAAELKAEADKFKIGGA